MLYKVIIGTLIYVATAVIILASGSLALGALFLGAAFFTRLTFLDNLVKKLSCE